MAQVIVCVLVVQLSPLPQLSGLYHLTFDPPRFLTTSLQLLQDFFTVSVQAQTQSLTCDVDEDGDVDRLDVNAIFNARGMPAVGDDPRDSNGDGFITINDGRFCVLQCTSPRCAILNRPVANAGPDQTVPRESTVQLDGSGSTDIDGQSLTYHWELLEKPSGSTAQLSDPTLVNPNFVVDQPGSYLLQLIVNDGTLDSFPDTVTINTSNSAPVAKAGEDQFVFVGDTTKLDGSASSDVDGDQLTFFWELTTLPDQSTAALSNPTAVMPTFLVDQPGTYEATLIVNDGTENSQPDIVIVTTQNSKPVADADGDQTAFVSDTVTLDGTGSHDVDGDQLTFSWALISKPDQSAASLTNLTDPNPTLTIDRFGVYVAQLIVNDATVDSDPDTVMITTLNSKPVADAGDDQTVGIQHTVQLDGRDSFDVDLNPLTFRWALTTRPPNSTATLTNDTTNSPSFVPDLSGTYIAQLIVNDATVDSDPDTVMITVINEPPQAANDSFETDEDRVLVIPTEGVLENDTDDGPRTNLTTVLIDDVTTGTLQLNANGSLIYTPAENQTGNATFTYRANDGELNSPELAMVDIMVKPVNDAPKITSTPSTDATDKATYLYQVEVTDPDINDTHTYSLQRGPAGMTINETSGLVQWKPTTNQVGDQTVTVRVEDAGGRADTQTFTINVTGVNAQPDVDAGPNQTVNEGDTVSLAPATFTDADTDDTHTAMINWGDGSPNEVGTLTQGAGNGTVDGSHPYINDGTFTVEVCVTDDDGANGCDTLTVQVDNIAPSLNAGPDQANNQGAIVSLPPALFTDPGQTDQHTSVVDWGDGTIEPGKVMQETGGGMIEGGHVYSARGPFIAEVCVQDGQDSACDEVEVKINGPPNISSTAITNASEQKTYTYQVTVDDPDPNETHTYALLTKPSGMSIDTNTGLIQWTPTDQQIGDHQVTVQVTDAGGLTDTQSYTIAVAQVVNPPEITAIPNQVMNEGTTLAVPVMASDPDGDPLTLTATGLHSFGSFVDNGNGIGTITFAPGFTNAGNYPTTVTVSDGSQSSATNFTLTVNNVNRPPAITSEAVTMGTEQKPYRYQVIAIDPDIPEQLTFFLDDAPDGMTIDSSTGLIEWTPGDEVITLDNSLLPSGQGWFYTSGAVPAPEANVFMVSGGILSQNTLGVGQGSVGIRAYGFANIVDPSAPFTLKVRARVLAEESTSATNSFGFAFGVSTATESFAMGLGTHRIQEGNTAGEAISTTIDNTVFHDYRMEGEFGVGFELYVDDVLVGTGQPRAGAFSNGIGFGDFTGGTNARAEIQSYSFSQPKPVTVRVQDAAGLTDIQSFALTIKVNQPPMITSEAVTMGREQDPYTYQVVATDPDLPDEELTFFLDDAPNDMTIDSGTGLIEWTPVETAFTLDTSVLPSGQGWTYSAAGESVPETDIFAVSGGILSHNTLGQGFGNGAGGIPLGIRSYGFTNIVDPSVPFTLKVRARVLEEESTSTTNSFGFAFGVNTATESFAIGLGTHRIQVGNVLGDAISTTIDNTVFHDYRMEGEIGVGFELYVDDVLVGTGPSIAGAFTNSIGFGDFTRGTNARAEILSYSFSQPKSVTVRVEDAGGLADVQSFTVTVKEPNAQPTAQPQSVTTPEDIPVEIILSGSDADGDALTCAIDTPPTQGTLGSIQQCVPPPSGLVSWWPGDGHANDIVGGNHGTLSTGGVTFVPGKVDQALNVDGTGFIQVPDDPTLEPEHITLDGWIRPVFTGRPFQSADVDTIIEKLEVAGSALNGYALVVAMDPTFAFLDVPPTNVPLGTPGVFLNISGTSHQIFGPSPLPDDGAYHHVAATYDGTTLRLFLDGDEVASKAVSGTIVNAASADAFIGRENVVGPRNSRAAIDEVEIFNRALSAQEIQTLFNAGRAGKCKKTTSSCSVTYTPNPGATGSDSFTFSANDGQLTSNPATVSIGITSDNQPPMITSTPNTLGIETHPYSYLVQATDPDVGDEPTFSLESAPFGMTIDEFTGLIAWVPSNAQVGNHNVTVKVTDERGAFDIQSYTVRVSALQDQITLVEPNFTASTCASGGMLDQPRGIVFDTAGNLLVANNTSALAPGQPALGTILRIVPLGTQEIFSSGDFFFGPLGLAFGPNSTSGFDGDLFVGVEDVDEAGVLPTDVVARIPANGGTPTVFFTQTEEPIGLRFGLGGAFGTSMYVAGRQHATDRKYRIFRVDASGAGTVFPLNGNGTEITGVFNFEFAPGGGFGTDLYVATGDDLDFIDPSAQDAIYRVDPTGAATEVLSGRRTGFLAFSPDSTGPFGEFLYATASQGEVIRINPQGEISTFATGFTSPFGLAFSPEGNLCVSDAGTGIIVQLSSTPKQLDPPVIVTSTPVTEAVVGESYVYDVEATSAQGSAGLTFSLAASPSGMSIDATTGLIEWTPGVGQVGDHDVVVRVKSPEGLIGVQLFAVTVTVHKVVVPDVVGLTQVDAEAAIIAAGFTVGNITTANSPTVSTGDVISQNPNADTLIEEGSAVDLVISLGPLNANGPSFTSDPVTQATQDQLYRYEAKATDLDVVNGTGDFLTFSLDLFPNGMTINDMTGLIDWIPTATQVGAHAITVRVTDSGGLFATQSFTVSVADVNDAPSFTTIPPTTGTQGQQYAYAVGITDPDPGDLGRFLLELVPSGMIFNPQTSQLLWTPTAQQVAAHQVQLRVEDQAGAFELQEFTITVANVNDPPSIISTPGDTGIQGVPYTYQPVVSDLDLGIDENLTFSFDSSVAPEGMTIDPSTGFVEWTPTAAQLGSNDVIVKVTDKGGLMDEQPFSVNVLTPNDTPIANAGRDVTIGVGKTAHLNGAGSYDVNGDRLTFAWTLRTFPLGTTATLSDTNALRPTLVPDLPGNFTVELIVNDGRASSTIDAVVISAINSPPVADAGNDQSVPVGTTVTLDSSGSTDVDGDPLTSNWELITVPLGSAATLFDPNAVQPSFTVDVAGTYEARLIVNDGNRDSEPDTVTITTTNLPPVADAGPDQTVAVGATVNLDGSGSFDPENDPRTHQWAMVFAPAGSTAVLDDPTSLTPTFVADFAGLYVVQLIEDDGQAASMPDTVVISTGRSPPVANAGADQSVDVNVTVNLDGTGSTDPDNDPFTATWSFLVVPNSSQAAFSDPTSLTPSFVTDKEGLYIAQLITNDGTEDSVPDTVVITAAIPTTTVPPVEGLIQETAETDIASAILTVGTIIPQNSATIAKGIIINQTPAAGAVVPEGTLINLVVSIADDDPVLATIDVTPTDLSLASGLTQDYTATGNLSDGTTQALTNDEVEWTSTSIPVAGIGSTGEARALDLGDTVIQATKDGVMGTTKLTVTEPTLVSIEVSPTEALLIEGETQPFTALGVLTDGTRTDLSGLVTWESDDQTIATIDMLTGVATALLMGGATMTAKQGAIEETATLTVEERVDQDTTDPIVDITSPAEVAELISPTDVIGTVTDDNLLFYELSLARVSDGTFIPFARGTTPVTSGVLGTIDTTLLENGMYLLRLFAKDQNGQTKTLERAVRIDGQAKVGNFTLPFVDMQIPVAGIPITLTRTYDSRDKTPGDFGFGWTLDISRGSYQNNRPPGEGWTIDPGAFNFPCQGTNETLSHFTEIRLSDREVYLFRPTLAITGPTIGGCFAQVGFEFVDGTRPGATLEVLGNTQVFSQTNSTIPRLLDLTTFLPFDPQQVRLTTIDGRVFDLDQVNGTFKIHDRNGNSLTINSNGVVHSTGRGISIARDGQGRITSITDPNDQSVRYIYDAAGDLVEVIDREKNKMRFIYENHLLLEIRDFKGRVVLHNEFNDSGRWVAMIDEEGRRVDLDHNLNERTEVILDNDSNPRTVIYDERGNVLEERDALGSITKRTYDADNNVKTVTNPLNGTTTYDYENGFRVLEQDPFLKDRIITRNNAGQIILIKDRLNRETKYTYDNRGNLKTVTDAENNTEVFEYDDQGNVRFFTNKNGHRTEIQFDDFGNPQKVIDPLGHEVDLTFNENGNLSNLSISITQGGGTRTLLSTFTYDNNGNLTESTDPENHMTMAAYDAAGNQTMVLDPRKNLSLSDYSPAGKLTQRIFPDRLRNRFKYTQTNQVMEHTGRSGRTKTLTYDQARRPFEVIFGDDKVNAAENPRITFELNAAGEPLFMTFPGGLRLGFTYDIAGQQKKTRIKVGTGSRTLLEKFYNESGQIKRTVDALSRETLFEYDGVGRLKKTIFPDLSTSEITYDGVGNVLTRKDQEDNVTTFEYDQLNRLVAVVDALEQRTEYEYDEVGNLILLRDAEGGETRFEYDGRGLRTAVNKPLGQRAEMTYDEAGNLQTLKDFNGHMTLFHYDALNRLEKKGFPDGTSVEVTFIPSGRVETVNDTRGITRYEYNDQDQLMTRTDPDGRAIHYTYAENTKVETIQTPAGTTSYKYNELDQLELLTNPDNQTTTYTYNDVGHLLRSDLPNGLSVIAVYDDLNRIDFLKIEDGTQTVLESYDYTYDDVGNVLTVVEQNGRRVEYVYDPLNRLESETIHEIGGSTRTIAYTFDKVSNRLSKTDSQEGTTIYTYDVLNRLVSEVRGSDIITYTYDNNGNVLTQNVNGATRRQFGWNPENRLTSATITGPEGSVNLAFQYDMKGIRVTTSVNGVEKRFLIDDNRLLAQVIEQYTPTGNIEAAYVYGPGIQSQSRMGQRTFYVQDGHSGVRLLADSAGMLTERYAYDAFGKLVNSIGSTPNDFLYRAQQFDPHLDQYYLRARYYDQHIGRFLSVDPLEGVLESPMTQQPYLYAKGNPITFVDPTGKTSIAQQSVELTIIFALVNFGAGLALSALQLAVEIFGRYKRPGNISWTGSFASGSVTPLSVGPLGVNSGVGILFARSDCTRIDEGKFEKTGLSPWVMTLGGIGVGTPFGATFSSGWMLQSALFAGLGTFAFSGGVLLINGGAAATVLPLAAGLEVFDRFYEGAIPQPLRYQGASVTALRAGFGQGASGGGSIGFDIAIDGLSGLSVGLDIREPVSCTPGQK